MLQKSFFPLHLCMGSDSWSLRRDCLLLGELKLERCLSRQVPMKTTSLWAEGPNAPRFSLQNPFYRRLLSEE